MTSSNGLVCFTNCLIPLENGTFANQDIWIDERRGVILDAQKTFFARRERPAKVINLGGNILSPGFIDIQINGAYGFDFSVYDGNDSNYIEGLKKVSNHIVETGVTSLVPTLITQDKALYPKLLQLLKPLAQPKCATMLGWHAEGPFIELAKRGAHAPPFLRSAPEGFKSFEEVYGAENLVDAEDWLMESEEQALGVRIITAAPEIKGISQAVSEISDRGIIFSIGHSIATSDIATDAVNNGARLITHLFNAMPQLHHRDPSIIGLLGSSPHLTARFTPITGSLTEEYSAPELSRTSSTSSRKGISSEAFDEHETPPQTPIFAASSRNPRPQRRDSIQGFERPFYSIIVDGIHLHPNSVRLAYSAFPEGCVLITDAMKILDPNLKDGLHEWRDGKRFVKEGDKLFLEGTETLAGSVVTLDKCVRNFQKFTGCSMADAIKCATYNPAKCLGIEDRKGTLRPGADADLVVLDKEGNVLSTWVSGQLAWGKV